MELKMMAKLACVGAMALMVLAGTAPAYAQVDCTKTSDALVFSTLPMELQGDHVTEDTQKIWTDWELWNPNSPRRSTIFSASRKTCAGEVIVSQIINRQCSSATSCPGRVVLRTEKQDQVLLDYSQMCTSHQQLELRHDLAEIRVCGQAFELQSIELK